MKIKTIIIFISVIVICLALFEVIIIGIAFFGADKIECNLLWCTFTTERSNINNSIIIETHKACFFNGYEIDCDDNRTNLDRIITDGNFDNQPIFKHDKKWIDILEVS